MKKLSVSHNCAPLGVPNNEFVAGLTYRKFFRERASEAIEN